VLEVRYHHAKFGGLGFHLPPGQPKTLSFLCPSRFCERCAGGVRQVALVVLRELCYLHGAIIRLETA